MSITLETLKQFCSDDYSRPAIMRPFSQEKWTYATDGRVLIRVNRLDEVPEYDDSPKNIDSSIMERNPISGVWFKIPNDLPKGSKCERCEGSGECECSCGDCHNCGNCGGSGESPKAIPVKVGNQLVSHAYLKQLSSLPNVAICNSAKDPLRGLGIRFEGGEGRVMPMRE